MLTGPTADPLDEENWKDRYAAVRQAYQWIESSALGADGSKDAKLQAMLVQFTPPVLRQLVNRVVDKSSKGALRTQAAFLALLVVICDRGRTLYSKLVVEAGILPVCVAIMRQDSASRVGYDHFLSQCLRLLTCVADNLFGLHPFLSAGVLFPHVFRAARNHPSLLPLKEAVHFVMQYGYFRGIDSVDQRPIIQAPAAIRATAAVCQQSLTVAPVDRVDLDSLCVISSCLCGCDFLRVIRVCRRWSGLRLKPAAWPSPQPCDAHIDEHVAAFYPLFEVDTKLPLACDAFSYIGAPGVGRLLDLWRARLPVAVFGRSAG
jgi:hypothetical protein